LEEGSLKFEVGNRKLEEGRGKFEVGNRKAKGKSWE
jgi:hypothetical protein